VSKTHDFFAGDEVAEQLYAAVARVVEPFGQVTVAPMKSQIALRRGHRTFAALWRPSQYVAGRRAPLVLTVFLPQRDPSPRWKEVVQPGPRHFTHHLEILRAEDVDAQVERWLRAAWEAAR
jgi:hypothetical protein